ncbi:hypothetical protein [Clostridium thermarum]|uniref:hypothetical protein n=1 Tax=Clostridium thermarum TaxID=1716543 RepID=UPI0013D6A92F|nr:hypothetical protein [Clostridium thermarum]
MFTQYFGQYLLNKGYLSAQQLQAGLEVLKDTRLKLGVLAVNAGYMTANEADKVNEAQKKYDKRFGELAVDMGYLTSEQVEDLLSSQKYGHLLLGQALVDKGYMSLYEFEKAISEYKKDYRISDVEFEAIQKDDVDKIVKTYIKFEGSKNEKLQKDYIALLTRNLIRFIDAEALIGEVERLDEFKGSCLAKQHIKGAISLTTYIEAQEQDFIKFASKFAQEGLKTVDEMTEASAGEFLNLQNGIFLVNMSNIGLELEMTPQEIHYNEIIHNIYRVPVDLSFGKINVLIKEE